MSTKVDPKQVFEIPVKGVSGNAQGKVSLTAGDLDQRVRYRLLKEAVLMYEANKRQGTHDTKTRGRVAGSGKKPWRQKGSGRARPGSRKSPVWRGGGAVFGPHPRDYSYAINRKQRRLAVRSALLGKLRDGQVLLLEGLDLQAPKTKAVAQMLDALGVGGRCLIGTGAQDNNLVLSVRNLPKVTVAPVSDFNARDVLCAETVILLRDAFDALVEASGGSGSATDSTGASE